MLSSGLLAAFGASGARALLLFIPQIQAHKLACYNYTMIPHNLRCIHSSLLFIVACEKDENAEAIQDPAPLPWLHLPSLISIA